MNIYLIVRVLHIVVAALWVGSAVYGAWFLMPAVRDSGPEGGKVMAALERRGQVIYFPIIVTTTVLSGLWLYYRYTGGFSPEVSRSHSGMAYGAGGALGILAMILGIAVISTSMKKATTLTTQALATADASARGVLLADAARLRARGLVASRIVSVLVVAAAALMSVAIFI